jgi:hypothetical protein
VWYNKYRKKENKEVTKMTKRVQKIINKYNDWVKNDKIYDTWTSDIYKNFTAYENVDGDVISLIRNDKGEIIDAWIE